MWVAGGPTWEEDGVIVKVVKIIIIIIMTVDLISDGIVIIEIAIVILTIGQ